MASLTGAAEQLLHPFVDSVPVQEKVGKKN